MRAVVTAVLLSFIAAGSAAPTAAQDLDELMSADPEAPEPESEEAPGAAEEEFETGDSFMDDERPPREEPAFDAEPEPDPAQDAAAAAARPLSAAVLVGYGLHLDDGPNPWGFGFGLRGGYNFGAFYIGARFVYYLGETATETQRGTTGNQRMVEVSASLWEFGFEAGYDIAVSPDLDIRPGLGLGLATYDTDRVTETQPFIAPGVGAMYHVSEMMFVGADARLEVVVVEPEAVTGLVLLAHGGVRF